MHDGGRSGVEDDPVRVRPRWGARSTRRRCRAPRATSSRAPDPVWDCPGLPGSDGARRSRRPRPTGSRAAALRSSCRLSALASTAVYQDHRERDASAASWIISARMRGYRRSSGLTSSSSPWMISVGMVKAGRRFRRAAPGSPAPRATTCASPKRCASGGARARSRFACQQTPASRPRLSRRQRRIQRARGRSRTM